MADNVNIKINQSIKGNRFSGKYKVTQKGRLRFTLPANVIINVRARQNINKKNPNSKIEANQTLNIKGVKVNTNQQKEPKSSD